MIILDGKSLAQEIKNEVKEKVSSLIKKPTLSCLMVEGNSASEIYVRNKQHACEECGMASKLIRLNKNISQHELEEAIKKENKDKNVSAILLQLPLPNGLDEESAINKIDPKKDADGLTNENMGKLFLKEVSNFAPCTPSGIIKLLDKYNVQIEGKIAVVMGRSKLVGQSIAHLLLQRNATVMLCHSKTKNLKKITRMADILVVAIGKAKLIKADFVKSGAVVVDVGINKVDGKLCGDVDFESVKEKCSMITPVPGGIGPLTVACLMENTYKLAKSNPNF